MRLNIILEPTKLLIAFTRSLSHKFVYTSNAMVANYTGSVTLQPVVIRKKFNIPC